MNLQSPLPPKMRHHGVRRESKRPGDIAQGTQFTNVDKPLYLSPDGVCSHNDPDFPYADRMADVDSARD